MSYTSKILSLAFSTFLSSILQACCPICHPECAEGHKSSSVISSISSHKAIEDFRDFGNLSEEGVKAIQKWIDDSQED